MTLPQTTVRALSFTCILFAATLITNNPLAQNIEVGQNVQVSASQPTFSHTEVMIAVDPNNPENLIAASMFSALQTAASLGTSLRSSSALPPSIVHILQLTAQTTNTMDACTSAQLFPILEPRTNHFHQTSTSIIQTIKETISSLPPGAL